LGFSGPSSTTEEGEWAELPEELMLMVLDRLDWELRESAAVRLTCLRWRNIHDGGCKTLRLCYRVTDEMVGALCARLPALTEIELISRSLTDEGLEVVAELTSLTHLDLTREPALSNCPHCHTRRRRANDGIACTVVVLRLSHGAYLCPTYRQE
jgi:hypothetical protein